MIQDLRSGKILSLISDAGTPGISDPGTRLVKRCVEEGIAVSALPGPCAAITALCLSGLDTERFQFYGFLPKQVAALKKTLEEILRYPFITICYESPARLKKVLEMIQSLDPERQLVIARELTKKFETVLRGKSQELLDQQSEKKFKGEIVLLIAGCTEKISVWDHLSVEEHVAKIQAEENISLNDAIKKVAHLRALPKRMIYNRIHHQK